VARSQQKVTLNGYVKDVGNGEELIGVTVYLPALKAGTVTNAYGFYSITVPPGSYDVQYSYTGFKTQTFTLDLTKSLEKNLELESEVTVMQEIEVTDKPLDANVVDLQMSKNTLNMEQVRKLPALFGEVDIIKNIQLLPGVISAGEGTSSFFVRGGGADQNLILIDEAPIYDPSHLGGMISVFNADVIKESELYKGGIPSRFGGRLSSILEVRTKDGNNKKLAIAGGLGTLASRVMVEGPIKKDKSSFILSGRTSNLGLYLKAAGTDNGVNFFDLNAKVNWRANNKNRFFVAGYSGRDKITFDGGDASFGWGNSTATFRWNHLFNERLFSNTSLIVSQFDYSLELKDQAAGFKWTSNLRELSLKNDLTYFINTKNELTFGYHVTGRQFSPARIVPNSPSSFFQKNVFPKMYALDHAVFISNQQQLTPAISLEYGARLSIFQNVGKGDVFLYEDPKDNADPEHTDTLHYGAWENIKTFVNLEPRLAIRYMISENQSLKLSYNRMVQNTHLISSGTIPLPFNTWSPSSYYLDPQRSDLYAIGYFHNLKQNMFEVAVETYYKKITNATDFADNAELFLNRNLSTEYRQGNAWAYGAEFMINKKEGRLTGMLTYTWSKAEREATEGVNNGRAFAPSYDRRHVANLVAAYDLNPKWTFGASFTYSTGRPYTIAAGKYEYGNYQPDLITERNGARLPAFHHLDLSATLNPKKNADRRFKGQWVFSIYNVYSRQNAFSVYTRVKQTDDEPPVAGETQKETRLIYLFPIMPFVTYNFKF
jgi:hypothetical protein